MTLRLELRGVRAGYGQVEVLHGVSLAVPAGRVVALLGPNGAGKTTALRLAAGLLPVRSGEVRLDGRPLGRLGADARARAGITLVPEGRGVFAGLSVAENLAVALDRLPPRARPGGRERALAAFPRLADRLAQRAGTLSGGEQQMLALARALVAPSRVLLLDEISMGLAPRLVEQLFAAVAELREQGRTIVVVEQYLSYALRFADIVYVLSRGEVAFAGEPWEIAPPTGDTARSG